MKKAIFSLALASAMTPADAAVQEWVRRHSIAFGDDHVSAMAVDTNGNVYITGYEYSGASGTGFDVETIAYTSAGSPIWTNLYRSIFADFSTAIAVGPTGVFVTGHSSVYDAQFNQIGDYFTAAYSIDGAPLWTNVYNGYGVLNGDDKATAVAVNAAGDVFVTGYSQYTNVTAAFTTIAYSSVGTPLWTNRYGELANRQAYATAIAVDLNGNVFVTGYSGATNRGPLLYDFDFATIKYSNDGTPLWTNRYNGPDNGDDKAVAIAVGQSGNVFVTGYSTNSGKGYDYLTIAYSNSGSPLWTNRYNGPGNTNDQPQSIAVDTDGNVLVTGSSFGTSDDFFTIKYASDGALLWENRFGADVNTTDKPIALTLAPNGTVFVSGNTISASSDYITVAYSSDGLPLWTNRYGTPFGTEALRAAASDADGNLFVSGISTGPDGTYDFLTIKYSIPQAIPLVAQKLNNQLVLTWTNPAFVLQASPEVTGVFTNVAGATSPYTNSVNAAQQFFRLIVN